MPYDDLRKGRFNEHWRAYFITTVLAEREKCYFSDLFCARFAVTEMRVLHDSGALNSLSSVVKQFKARSARRVNDHLNRQGPLWQKAFYDHAVRKDEDIRHIARYIVANPLRAGLVDKLCPQGMEQ